MSSDRSILTSLVALLVLLASACGDDKHAARETDAAVSPDASMTAVPDAGIGSVDTNPDSVAAAFQERTDLNITIAQTECTCDPLQFGICEFAGKPHPLTDCVRGSLRTHAKDLAFWIACDKRQDQALLTCLNATVPCDGNTVVQCATSTSVCDWPSELTNALMSECPNG